MEVKCDKILGTDGHFNVSVTTTLFNSPSNTHIRQFTFSPEVKTNETIETFEKDSYIPQVSTDKQVRYCLRH